MSDNKPKIDLKARLGKKTVSAPVTSSVPPPVGLQRPGVAQPIRPSAPAARPPIGAGGSVPAPPFGAQPSRAPRIDPNDPYSSVSASSAPAVAQRPREIRVDMEEVRAANKGRRGRVLFLSVVTAAVGGFIGFTFGGGVERGKAAQAAVIGSKELLKEVEESNAQIQQLADTLKAARTKLLGKGTYPQEEVTKLGSINIPFKPMSLLDKGIGRFKRDTMVMLIDYATGVEAANDQKESLQRLLGSGSLKAMIEEQKAPKVRWMAQVNGGPGGPWINLNRLPEANAFPAADKWPEALEIKDGDKTVKFKRYVSGDPAGSEPPFIPVSPESQGPSDVIGSLISQLLKMDEVLRGNKDDPTNEKTGLLERGQKLADSLKRIGKDP
jgi:hypothetical protein